MFFGVALRVDKGWRLGQKVLLIPSWNLIFSQPGFEQTQWAWFILACCIDWIFLHFIFMTQCCFRFLSLGNSYKPLVLPLSSITFTANSQADNHFYEYIYLFLLFQVLCNNGLQKKTENGLYGIFQTVYRKTSL